MQNRKYLIRFSWTYLACQTIDCFDNKYIHTCEFEKEKLDPLIS